MANESPAPQNTPNVIGVISEGERRELLETGTFPAIQHKLGQVGVGDVVIVHDTDEAGYIRSTRIVDARNGTELDDETRASSGLGTPAEEKVKLAKRDTERIRGRHDRSGFKTPYGGGSR